jgi:hypothetical protein
MPWRVCYHVVCRIVSTVYPMRPMLNRPAYGVARARARARAGTGRAGPGRAGPLAIEQRVGVAHVLYARLERGVFDTVTKPVPRAR